MVVMINSYRVYTLFPFQNPSPVLRTVVGVRTCVFPIYFEYVGSLVLLEYDNVRICQRGGTATQITLSL